MSTTISKIVPLFNFNEACYFLTYTPLINAPNDLGSAGGIGSYTITNTDSVNGTIAYTMPSMRTGNGNYTTYDATINAYNTWLTEDNQPVNASSVVIATPGVSTTGSGSLSVTLTGQDTVSVNYVYDQNGWDAVDKPQGLLIATGECNNGLVRVYAQAEAKLGDNGDFALTDALQLWNIDTNTQYTNSEVVIIVATTHAKIWDLGFVSPSTLLNLRVIGNASISGTVTPSGVDFINKSITTPNCPISSATPTNDNVGIKTLNTVHTIDVSTNDTACSLAGTRTFAFVGGSAVNATSISNSGEVFSYTVTNSGAFSFQYNILCNGIISGTATVSGTGATVTADATNKFLNTSLNTPLIISLSIGDTLCN